MSLLSVLKRSLSTMPGANGLKLALIQLAVGNDKSANISKALNYIKQAKDNTADIAILPECFNSPYGTKYFPQYAESIPDGQTSAALSKCAADNKIFIVAGSFPEKEDSKLYNACTIWNPDGQLVAKHRKIHLFDIDIPNGITFKESEVLSPGITPTVFQVNQTKIGVGICYDVRFAELAHLYRDAGCSLLIYPGAFNLITGPMHWTLLMRGRAVDNQLYVAAVSPARDMNAGYHAYGHSMFVDPLGNVVQEAGTEEEVIYAELDFKKIDDTRQQIPILKQRRTDVYSQKL